jgi:tRNA (cmo5U34)-methyltransferase
LQRMTAILLAERAGPASRILVLGAGGGLELKVFADTQPDWTFVGVDPSAEMLALAEQTIGPHAARVQFHKGMIDSAPDGPFDGATCLLTLHFVPRDQRVDTLAQLHRRLRPGAPLVLAHHSFPQAEAEKHLWLGRFAAFAEASGIPAANARNAAQAIAGQLPVLSPDQEEAALRDAGFADISLFYAAFSFRGWVAYAA